MKNLDPDAARATAVYDPGNQYGVDYTWLISVGMGYDVNKVKARLTDAPLDSWRLMFDPKLLSKLRDCGVSVLDSPDDVVGSVLAYLGKDPNSESPEDLASAAKVLQRHTSLSAIRRFHAICRRPCERRPLPRSRLVWGYRASAAARE